MVESPEVSPSREDSDMTPEKAAEHLRIIRELMERPIRQTTRSGLAAIVAGLLALAGSAATVAVWSGEGEGGLFGFFPPANQVRAAALIWLGVLVLAAAMNILITWRRARQSGLVYWKRAQLQTGLAIAPGFVLAAFFTWFLAAAGFYQFIPFAWMIGYGMALWTVGMFSITEVKVLGAAFLLAGWLGLWFLEGAPIAMLAVTFGGFHLIYGAVVWIRHGG